MAPSLVVTMTTPVLVGAMAAISPAPTTPAAALALAPVQALALATPMDLVLALAVIPPTALTVSFQLC